VRGVIEARVILLLVFAGGLARAANSSPTLERVRAAGVIHCAVDAEEPEYSTTDDHGNRAAFDADLCRAVAVAVMGVDAKVVVTNYPDDAAAMAALEAGKADLIPTLGDDFTHATDGRVALTRPVLWDGVGFLLPAGSGVVSARQLSGKKVCFLAGSHVEETVRGWFARNKLDFVAFPFSEEGEMQAAFATGNCAALAGERTRLAGTRATLAEHGRRARLLDEAISNDPLAMVVRSDDAAWLRVVSWVMEALVAAEESGITEGNVSRLRADDADVTRRFLLGGSKQIGAALGLDDVWVAGVIAATGNYGEIYERDLGSGSAMRLPRGVNNLRGKGGVMMALPLV
jgi:general L-amino acid transport system substrate-binding protein